MGAVPETIVVKIDQEALAEQVAEAVSKAHRSVSLKLREAADMLDPEFMENHNKWLSAQAPRSLPEVDVNRLAQYFYEEGGTTSIPMTAKGDLVNALIKALNRIGFAIEYEEKG